jgi:hypothetical protein
MLINYDAQLGINLNLVMMSVTHLAAQAIRKAGIKEEMLLANKVLS